MTVGAILLGMLGDKLGRHKTLMVCMALFAVSTLLTAFATHLNHIFILRVIAGLGMGGATPVLLSLASEYAPKRHKGLVTTGILLALPAGAMLGGILAAKILPLWGWQSIYILGGVLPLILLLIVYFALPESLEYLSQHPSPKNIQKIEQILTNLKDEVKNNTTFEKNFIVRLIKIIEKNKDSMIIVNISLYHGNKRYN